MFTLISITFNTDGLQLKNNRCHFIAVVSSWRDDIGTLNTKPKLIFNSVQLNLFYRRAKSQISRVYLLKYPNKTIFNNSILSNLKTIQLVYIRTPNIWKPKIKKIYIFWINKIFYSRVYTLATVPSQKSRFTGKMHPTQIESSTENNVNLCKGYDRTFVVMYTDYKSICIPYTIRSRSRRLCLRKYFTEAIVCY